MYRLCIAFGLCLICASATWAQDRVSFLDRTSKTGGTLLRSGSIVSEDPGKVTLNGGDGRRSDIPVTDIVEVIYDGEPQVELNAARAAERDRKIDAALAGYQEAMKKAGADKKLLRRHLEYKIAEMRTAQADAGANPTQAIESLRVFAKSHPESRQIIACYDQLGRWLIASAQSPKEIMDALAQLRSKYGTDNKEVAARCDLLRSDFVLQDLQQTYQKEGKAGAKAKAEPHSKALAEIITIADRTVQPDLLAKQTFCQAFVDAGPALSAWETQIKNSGDDQHSKAAIHLTRADYQRLQQNYKEAMWDYLWVDTVYFTDRVQQAKALYHLIEVFDKLGDSAKSRDCKERLLSDARLRDTRYQKLALGK